MTFEMFRFFAALQKQHPEYIMLILTKDDDIKVIEEAVKVGVPAENLRVTYSTRKDLPSYLALSSCSIFFIRNTFSKTASSPTKHAELMGMGVPVICNAIGDTGNIIDTTHTGIVLNEFDESSIGMAISHIKELEQIDKWQIRKSAKEIFDLEAGARKYSDLYGQILEGKQVATII
jgi:glycosyltransferase involved in cell wall biosynthesis